MLITEFLSKIHDALDRDVSIEGQEVVIEDMAGVGYEIDRIYCVSGSGVGIDIKEIV